jgi:Ca-activated chloride channel homolog
MRTLSYLVATVMGLVFSSAAMAADEEGFANDFFTSENDDVADGNELLNGGKVAKALESYEKAARALPNRGAVHLNRGLALTRMGEEQLDQAMQAFKVASENGTTDAVRARALANLGDGFFNKDDFAEAIKQYKKSLMLVPGNKDVAWNYELASQKKKEQDEQQKENQDKENQDKENQDKENQDQENQDPQNKDDKKQDEQKQDEQKQDEKKQDEQKQDEKKQEQPKTKQEVEQLLNSLDNQDDNLQKQMARQRGVSVPAGRFKDW